ncbi:hypothetical protein HBIAX_02197 [Achromobacter xylosoxidans]|nr:hypothetical protein HBIAX_02197 [Achromobacter xylosoxidans]
MANRRRAAGSAPAGAEIPGQSDRGRQKPA